MNVYDRYVLPKLIDFACGIGPVMNVRRSLIPRASGEVLEIGIGTGLNLAFYDAEKVHSIIGVDPAAQMHALGAERARLIDIPVEMIAVDVQGIAAETARFDTIVMTFTLCSIVDPMPALIEMRRVLKPDGQLLFAEHGLSPHRSVSQWQHRLTPAWRRVAGGCHLDRDIGGLITAAGFELTECREEYIPGPKPMTYVYAGRARVERLQPETL
ncbi:class I SAM-dependent methyltransferase [Halopseudomonas nanhaiensis]|uniref:class I SAM-dependent methyltransferase n=1 Tax=Halopseudomonas nanhaiensis TaxID=2830842 RepID=UPI001CC158D6|nr:class I SAM-dependent methyltransferase [Halopseudomonas nanhaiensis]UAW98069.1 class I SAM-dependent methyltransferase [Halopseudomonas nanhaiensis]